MMAIPGEGTGSAPVCTPNINVRGESQALQSLKMLRNSDGCRGFDELSRHLLASNDYGLRDY
jgi:hypothetical protein